MKNNFLIIILVVLFSNQLSYGQKNESAEFNSGDLIGVWYSKYNREGDNLIFEKRKATDHKYGLRVEILKNGEFYNRYSAPCGNDTRLRTHNYKGKWSLNESEWVLTTTEPINLKGKIYKIVELQADKLILAEIKTE
ncbi:hypothetical protein [Flavobacterium soli]|uniref:hypothetical protein n=1 Tax=Flavobacterium soli TaxID=344881 RepID=UPI0004799E0C|nr:hypothetical protein [Flavobacterium soli]